MTLKPLHNQVALKVVSSAPKSESGLIVTSREPPSVGIVYAIGDGDIRPDGTHVPIDLQIGDMVHFNKTAGVAVEFDGGVILMIKYEEIFAVINK